MRFGFVSMNTAGGIRPDRLARELEERGFDSVWLPEHSHIPVSRRSPYPNGGDLPEGYLHMMDPFTSLTAAAMATRELVVASGVCLLLEHDLLSLAKRAATLDVLSGGRLLLGVGVGWNREELADHRPDLPFSQRYSAMRERVAALRAAWGDDEASFDGRWDRFSPSWVFPKPGGGRVPIALGNSGPLGLRHAAEYADHWCPINTMLLGADGRPDVEGGITRFRDLAAEAGRDPGTIGISLLMFSRPTEARLERYLPLGLDRVVLTSTTATIESADDTLRLLDQLTPLVQAWRTR